MTGLKEYIEHIVPITQVEWEQIKACTEKITLAKTDILLKKNAKLKKEIFVMEGVIRAFIVDNNGNEKTTGFFRKNEFVSMSSFRTRDGLSLYTYQALTPSVLVLIDREAFSLLFKQLEKLKYLVKAVKEKETDRLSNRDECLLQVRAEEKYQKFRQSYPGIESDIAHHYIASYLGITPVSLSRIRKKSGIQEFH